MRLNFIFRYCFSPFTIKEKEEFQKLFYIQKLRKLWIKLAKVDQILPKVVPILSVYLTKRYYSNNYNWFVKDVRFFEKISEEYTVGLCVLSVSSIIMSNFCHDMLFYLHYNVISQSLKENHETTFDILL